MPRRNFRILLALLVLSLMCSQRVSRHGRILVYAMRQIDHRALERVSAQELFEGALTGMLGRLDQYSSYIDPALLNQFMENLDKEFGGVGIEIILDPETEILTVASPLVGTPAYEAGIQAGDKVLRIDGKSTQGLSLEDAAQRMRGEPGESVVLTIRHLDEEEEIDVELVRAIIQVDTVLGDTRNADGSWNFFLEDDDRIGYLRINSFGEKTHEELEAALVWLSENDMKGLILDLRNDPGGLLGAAVRTCDLLIEDGVIVTTRDRHGRIRDAFGASPENTFSGFPLAVVINERSASASEIVAACLQDHDRAVVVGQRSFGKGTVQELIDLQKDQGKLKLTTASYWRPSDENIHRHKDAKEDEEWGVSPDPGYDVKVDAKEQAELLRARLRRDIYRTGENGEASEPDDTAATYSDPQLDRAIEYVQSELGSK